MRRVLFVLMAAVVFSGCRKPTPEVGGTNLTFAGVEYLHRYSNDNQQEFTPRGQEDLDRWSDMLTICYYRNVTEGEGLAATANAVLENYKVNGAMILKTDSVPMTKDRPAEHFVAVVFPRPEFIESVFARFKIAGGLGCCVIYSHREYGRRVGDDVSAWLQKNGPGIEKELMNWEQIPAGVAPKHEDGQLSSGVVMSNLDAGPAAGLLPKEATPWPELSLTGVLESGSSGSCLVNGQVVSVGERVAGVKIVGIKKDAVVAEFQGEQRVLRIQRR